MTYTYVYMDVSYLGNRSIITGGEWQFGHLYNLGQNVVQKLKIFFNI